MIAGKPQARPLGITLIGLACAWAAECVPWVTAEGAAPAAVAAPAAPRRPVRKAAPAECAPAPTSSLVTSVRDRPFNAGGDGLTDDTLAIQRAIDTVAGSGGTLLIPDGVYLINPTARDGRKGLCLGSRMTLRLAPKAVLKALPSSAPSYALLSVASVSEVNILGGTLLGERDSHTGTTGEWGMGLDINHATDVTVEDVVARECWGDGFYIGADSRNITLCRVTADHNRRQGLSITSAGHVVIRASTFKHTEGTPGESGLDIEPNRGQTVSDVLITGCAFTDNAGEGFSTGVPIAHTGASFVRGVVFERNTLSGNGTHHPGKSVRNAIDVSNASGTRVTGNLLTHNNGRGILLRHEANDTLCTGNTVTATLGPPGDGIVEDTCSGNTITGNTVTGNTGHGIQSAACRNSTIKDNKQAGNGL